ncbi:MAG: DNA damage-inducible protein D [Terriglobales bacterium]|jgi:DNA-damage-inducible protein D
MDNPLTYIVESLEKIKNIAPNGTEYWKARELMVILAYADWTNFRKVIGSAIEACDKSGILSNNHFREFTDMVEVGSGAKRNIENWYLTRYASYLIAMNGDSSKPEIATAQSYFAAQTLVQESQEVLTEAERRILLRNRVKDANRKLGGAAKDAGVRSAMFGVFQDAGYKGLYGGRGVQALKQIKGIPSNEDLLDCIGRAELAANEFRITQAEEKLRLESIKGEQAAINTHAEVGRKVRKAIEDIGGTMPEKLPAEPSIKKLAAKKAKELKGK